MSDLLKNAPVRTIPGRSLAGGAQRHMPQLDGLRGLAVTAVIFHHTMDEIGQAWSLGFFGVELFFVLSGFLIAGILLRAHKAAEEAGIGAGGALCAFYARRFLRIFPLYYGVLLLASYLDMPQVRENLWLTLTYITNMSELITFDRMRQPLDHLWTLASEEQFYLIVPALLLFSRWRSLPGIAIVMIVLAPISRFLFGTMWHEMRVGMSILPGCLDTLGAGVLLAIVREMKLKWYCPYPKIVAAAGALMAILLITEGGWLPNIVVPMSLISLFTMIPFVWLVSRASLGFGGLFGRVLGNAVLRYIGKISYGMYLLHEFVRTGCAMWLPHNPPPGWVQFGVVFSITVVLAVVSWYLFESPINKLKFYFPYVGPARIAKQTSRGHDEFLAAEPMPALVHQD